MPVVPIKGAGSPGAGGGGIAEINPPQGVVGIAPGVLTEYTVRTQRFYYIERFELWGITILDGATTLFSSAGAFCLSEWLDMPGYDWESGWLWSAVVGLIVGGISLALRFGVARRIKKTSKVVAVAPSEGGDHGSR